MSYADEPGPEATLLEGRIKVSVRGKEVVLHPGQQARETEVTDGVDTEATIAWKEGLFEFHKSDIGSVMRQIARWYDVEVIYEGPRTTHSFSGSISRDNNASAVLRVLELSGVHFRIEGRKIIVMP
jgi:ferric-dicitrate binding protein FerR (iron transport regulator)